MMKFKENAWGAKKLVNAKLIKFNKNLASLA